MRITKYREQEVKETPHKIDVREMYNKEILVVKAPRPTSLTKVYETHFESNYWIS